MHTHTHTYAHYTHNETTQYSIHIHEQTVLLNLMMGRWLRCSNWSYFLFYVTAKIISVRLWTHARMHAHTHTHALTTTTNSLSV